MDLFSSLANFASIAGLVATIFAVYYAKSARQAAREARKGVRRANTTEALGRIGDTANLLQACVETDQPHEAVVRARDLVSDVSRYKLRYERFLDPRSRARLDEARAQIGVISRSLTTAGVPATLEAKKRLLRICHENVVIVLNEESARILAGIEKEDE
jgi:uncharacterized protein YijF (DUF1287 family)